MCWAATAACVPAPLLPSPVRPRCTPACSLWPLTPSASGTAKTASLAPRYRPLCLSVPNNKFCISLADSLRQNQINISRKRPQNPGFYPCPLPSLLGYKGSFLFIFFLILQICSCNCEERVPRRSEKWLFGSPDAVPGVWVPPWQEGGQSKLIQAEEGSRLCLTTSLFNHLQLKTRSEAVLRTQQKGDNPGVEACFGGCISSPSVARQQT